MHRRPLSPEQTFVSPPVGCFHGGKFFAAVGPRFDDLDRAARIINADVLDAWFPPAPAVLDALREYLPWLARTSPPTACEGFVEVVAERRGVPPENVLPGAGSSDLIFRAFRHWLDAGSSVLLLDPTYGEYAHVLERVIGCRVDRLPLARTANYDVDLDELERESSKGYDLVVLVNPNSPTGRHIGREALENLLRNVPAKTRVWVDETYVEYVGEMESVERFAVTSENVVVCKSMSKVYALSGLRAAYLCASTRQVDGLRAITPPWVLGLPTQLAAVRALENPGYYAECYRQTHGLRAELAAALGKLGWSVVPGCANFLLAELPIGGPIAQKFVERCQSHKLYLRDAAAMGTRLGERSVRLAVKDAATSACMLEIIRRVTLELSSSPATEPGTSCPCPAGFPR